jgi:UTP--glucose-1-phosphate uridylyltransferase
MLRETAHCAEGEMDVFQDVEKHHYFNTNNLWLDLDALAAALEASPSGLPLPVIRNAKRVSPKDPESPRCYQLETAMGSAVECFDGARAIAVPRDRFAPVKTTSDLLGLWSDAYRLTEDARMVAVDPAANRARTVELDPRYYGHVDDLQKRFPEGAPSLVACHSLRIEGDHRFGADVRIEGDVHLVNRGERPVEIAAGTRLTGRAGD